MLLRPLMWPLREDDNFKLPDVTVVDFDDEKRVGNSLVETLKLGLVKILKF